MRLKSLEIKGFKSFADKTVVSFDEGVTGIIGPNGCGKSNIIDSIRWVIGEQKISHLRSENLESLVFNGSKTRSASGLAEVSLTFENTRNLLPTEFSTVTVTRKFYKSGESEYRLNDVQCRLKDIQNLFLDTGVSTDSYAIIELGMVDDIIKDKDNSRRRMLEQAAGITIYKTRKKEAKNKLDATEQDLARIEDLLFEINNQLKTLENQAKKAEKYYEIKKEYREVSIELAKAALEGFNLTWKTLNEQHDEETNKKVELEAKIATDEAAIEQEKVGFIEKERELHSMQHSFNDILQNLRTKENEKNLAQQRLHYLKEKETSLKDFLAKAGGQLKGIEESIQFTDLQIQEEEVKLNDLGSQLDTLRSAVESTRKVFDEKRSGIDEIRKENQAIQRSQFEAEKNVAVGETSIQNLQRTIFQLKEEQANRKQQLQQLEEDKQQKEHELANCREELQNLQEQHEFTKEQILQTQSALEGLRNQLADENRKLDSKKNEYDLLKSLVDSMEGYPDSVKFLHNNPDWNVESPLLSDVIYCKEEYRTAVENLLEQYLNYYVVGNMNDALKAVNLLHGNQKGKANFFMLDQFNGQQGLNEVPAGTIAALSVVEVDAKYQSLINYLLGQVVIAEDENNLPVGFNGVVLEKTGKFFKGKYSLSGGSVGLFEGKKLGRAKNLERLHEEILAQETVVLDLKHAIQMRHNEVIGFNEQLKENAIKETESAINQLVNQVYGLDNRMENLRGMEANAVKRLEDLELQQEEVQENQQQHRDELDKYNAQLDELAGKLEAIEQEYAAAERGYSEANQSYNDYNLNVTRQQSKVTSLKTELEFKRNQLMDLQLQVTTNSAALDEAANQINDSEANLLDAQDALVTLLQNKETEERKLNEADQYYYNLRNALGEKESELRSKQKEKELVDHSLSEIKDKLTDLKLQLSGTKERLQVEFKVNLEEVIEEDRTGDESQEDLQAKVDRMKKRLENLGEVNPTAIEAFEEMRKRYEFILEQKNDLVTAKESLLQTIQEVEATANQRFLETFNQVRENFQKVFKALFTDDDTADMVLENPENLAETGIDIVAKPKGKRPSSITQLSGGEKTLTATAMLFAIYLIKPAPFCILDEVDAPLDDANVGKFTNMIRKFSENSQFIIVTHNKQTMGAVDVIYGVTMQEAGVSKLVPVDFRNLN
ncbi:chromosome segregation protein SMC [Lacibacter luteus]|uniref:Chromosome partition protein Smc n=1 Tax=Lacibacter luteus TaxID=2508719 RepID=A0A4Q1CMD3_9BACT|nr:chromosome segregation protein SMC [Lacibacter luteus]RXK62170.1 chromosome segregation protein SMC [Lacibacter luteus]